MKIYKLILLSALITTSTLIARSQEKKPSSYLDYSWKHVATKMPTAWYGSAEAKLVAANILLSQKEIGGWEKNKPYNQPFTDAEKAHYQNSKSAIGATFDNGATITELRFLAKVYTQLGDESYKKAFEKGLNYIFISQYENGGWPQFFPVRSGGVSYSGHITYNDGAMVNTMNFLKDVYTNQEEFAALKIADSLKAEAKKVFDKGVDCILKTQIVVNHKPTVWCAQHDEKTLLPAKARAYELASFSGAESVGIVSLLMDIEHPSKAIINAVNGAVEWFDHHKVEGIKLQREVDKDGKRDLIVVADKNASPLWGRFYDLETSKPYFCSRDGIKRNALADISYERRNGYSWYTNAPQRILSRYPTWEKSASTN